MTDNKPNLSLVCKFQFFLSNLTLCDRKSVFEISKVIYQNKNSSKKYVSFSYQNICFINLKFSSTFVLLVHRIKKKENKKLALKIKKKLTS